ncbi:MAG: C1 family peptidase [Flavobacteriales bacterium]|nr:C1 family peptidase [Flavobacteriales bacterium]
MTRSRLDPVSTFRYRNWLLRGVWTAMIGPVPFNLHAQATQDNGATVETAYPMDGALLPTRTSLLTIPSERFSGPPKGFIFPREVDLRPFLPPPGDQGKQNACIAWALAYGLKSLQHALVEGARPADSLPILDPSRTYSPAFAFNLTKTDFDTTDHTCLGSYFNEVFSVLVERGCCTWEQMPYDPDPMGCFQPVSKRVEASARAHGMADPQRVTPYDKVQVRYHLARNEPVAFAMGIDTAFMFGGRRAARSGREFSWTPACAQPMPGSHAMLVVGYDDEDSTYLVMNSWGTEWGEAGFFRLPYAVFGCHVVEAYFARSTPGDRRPTAPILSPASRPVNADRAMAKLSMGQAVQVKDVTIGVAHIALDHSQVRVQLSDSLGLLRTPHVDLVEDQPVRVLLDDGSVTLTYTTVSRKKDVRRTRAHIVTELDEGGSDPAVERALLVAERIRTSRNPSR